MSTRALRVAVSVAAAGAFLVLWAAIAAHPWGAPVKRASDPRVAALAERTRRLRHEAAYVRRLVARRWAVYGRRLRARERLIAAAQARHAEQEAAAGAQPASAAVTPAPVPPAPSPVVTVVTTNPITTTRSSR